MTDFSLSQNHLHRKGHWKSRPLTAASCQSDCGQDLGFRGTCQPELL